MDEPTVRPFLVSLACLALAVGLPIAVGWIARMGGFSAAAAWGLGGLTGGAVLSGMLFVHTADADSRRGP